MNKKWVVENSKSLTLVALLMLFGMGCSGRFEQGTSIVNNQRMIDILADVQLVESKVASYNLWQKDSVSSLLYFQLSNKYKLSQDSINYIIQQSLKDPIHSQRTYELVAQRLDSINSTIK